MQNSIQDGIPNRPQPTRSGATPRRGNYAQDAQEEIRQAIVSGKLRPNQRLVESELARELEMSRTPVREAVKLLEMQGYVTKLPSGGVIVTDHSPSQIRNLCEVREALETMAMKLACQRATGEQLERAEAYHNRSIEVIQRREVDEFIRLNIDFHSELYAACGNEQLLSLIETFRDQVFDRRIVRAFTKSDWRAMATHHARFLEAVRKRDTRLAEKIVHNHVRIVLKIGVERL